MIKLKDFLTLIKPGFRLDLYVDGTMSLSCDVEDAIKTFKYDKRGELLISPGSVSFYEQSNGYAGLYNKYVVVYCYNVHKTFEDNIYSKIYDELNDISATIRLINLQKGLDSFKKEIGDKNTSDRILKLQERLNILKDGASKNNDTIVVTGIDTVVAKLADASKLQYEGKIKAFDIIVWQIDNELGCLLRHCNNKL